MRSLAVTLVLVGFLAACSPGKPDTQTAPITNAATATRLAVTANRHFGNAFAYCRAVGTIDHPDARYTGPNPPPAVIQGLINAFNAPSAASHSQAFTRGTSWRCMDGAVYACNVGANLPCESKANTRRSPTDGEKKYCAAHHDSDFIPMYVTGHNTIYDWSCQGDQPVAGKTLSQVDARGYIADIWHVIPPPDQPGH